MTEACAILKTGQINGKAAYLGGGTGPAAKDFDDKAYQEYVARLKALFSKGLATEKVAIDPRVVRQSVGGMEYDRIVANVGSQRVTVLTKVQEGRCVCYWYVGPTTGWETFVSLLGQVKVTAEGARP
jgi:hypothetical protein